MDAKKLKQLLAYGQSYWLDNLSRDIIRSGELNKRVKEQGLRGVTSNPKTFSDAIAGSDAYDSDIRRLADSGETLESIYDALMVEDIVNACDVLRPVYDASGGADGFVSLEVDPRLARHSEPTLQAARRLNEAVSRPNCMIKIPGTEEGLLAIEEALFEGINVNITLLFTLGRYKQVVTVHQRAMDRRRQAGKPLAPVASVASFFLSRIDTLVDELIDHRDTEGARNQLAHSCRGELAVALARLVYRQFGESYNDSPAWQSLAANGAKPQRPLWASTGTKNPAYKSTKYVDSLIAPDTVSTMPEATTEAFAKEGTVQANSISEAGREPTEILETLTEVGIDLGYVGRRLEDEGIQKFIDPYEAAIETIEEQVNSK